MKKSTANTYLVLLVVVAILSYIVHDHITHIRGIQRSENARNNSKINLMGIGKAIAIYSNSYADQRPPSLLAMIDEKIIPAKMLYSPMVREEVQTDTDGNPIDPGHYIYTQLPDDSESDLIMAYEKLEHHKGAGTCVLFNDFHVEWMYMKEFRTALTKTEKWIAEHKAGLEATTSSAPPQKLP